MAIWGGGACVPSPAQPVIIFASPDSPRLHQVVAGIKNGLGEIPLKVVCIPEFGQEGNEILRRLRREKPPLFIVLGTSALLRLAAVEKSTPTVFAMVANPYFSGAAYDPQHPDWHQFNITGIASPAPLQAALDQGVKLLGPRPWGMIFDPLDGVAVELADRFVNAATASGLPALVEPAGNAANDHEALEKLLARGAHIIYLPPTASATRYAPLLLSWGQAGKVLVVNGHPEVQPEGAILSVTLDYVRLGEETARLALRVLQGEHPRRLPIMELTPLRIVAHETLLRRWSSYPLSSINKFPLKN